MKIVYYEPLKTRLNLYFYTINYAIFILLSYLHIALALLFVNFCLRYSVFSAALNSRGFSLCERARLPFALGCRIMGVPFFYFTFFLSTL
jgi:hypothetical protein